MNHLQGFGLFFLLGGVVGVCGGIEQVFRKRAQAMRAVAVTARIVAVESEGGVEPGDLTHFYPVVAFTVDGKPVRAKLLQPSIREGEYQSGKAIRVYYDPRDPTQVVARLRDCPGGWTATILGAVFAAIGAGLCWVGWNP
jgi:hypothetical protein